VPFGCCSAASGGLLPPRLSWEVKLHLSAAEQADAGGLSVQGRTAGGQLQGGSRLLLAGHGQLFAVHLQARPRRRPSNYSG